MDTDTLTREIRRIRSQIARPLDDDWEDRYMRTKGTGHVTGRNSATVVIRAPEHVTKNTAQAATREYSVVNVLPRNTEGREKETLIALASKTPY